MNIKRFLQKKNLCKFMQAVEKAEYGPTKIRVIYFITHLQQWD